MAIFDDRAAGLRLQEAASAWQQNDPRFKQLLDIVSQALYTRSASALAPADNRLLSMLTATAQNSFGFLGNPVANLVGMNRAVISGAVPITAVDHRTGQLQTSYSYGTGNVSTTASTAILKAFEAGMSNGQFTDLTKTHGLNADQRAQLTAAIVERNGIRPGSFYSYDLSEVRSSADMEEMINYMRKNGAAESSLQSAQDVRSALSYYERTSGLSPDKIKNMASYELEASMEGILKDVFDESVIKQSITVMQGKATNFQVLQESFNRELSDVYGKVAENVKDLTELFGESDINKIRTYARGMGMANVLDSTKAHEVRAQLRDIQVEATLSGKSIQEVGAQRMQISSGLSVLTGGKPAHHDTVSRVMRAGTGDREGRAYTSEESMSKATVSQAAYENEAKSLITLEGLIKENYITDRDAIAAWEKINTGATGARTLDEFRKYEAQAEKVLNKYGSGIGAVTRNSVLAQYSPTLRGRYDNALVGTNIERGISNYLSDSGLSINSEQFAAARNAGELLFRIAGNDESIREEFFSLYRDNKAKARDYLISKGGSEDDVNALVSYLDNTKLSSDKLPSLYGFLNSDWVQSFEGDVGRRKRNKTLGARLLSNQGMFAQGKDVIATSNEFLHGLLGEGKSLSAQEAGNFRIANILHEQDYHKRDISSDAEALSRVGAFSLGKLNEDGELELTEEQRARIKHYTNISDEDLDALLPDTSKFLEHMEGAGFSLSGERDREGNLIAISTNSQEAMAKSMNKKLENQNARGLSIAFGKHNIIFDSKANLTIQYGKKTYDSAKSAYTALINSSTKANKYAGLKKVAAAAKAGDKVAQAVLDNWNAGTADNLAKSMKSDNSGVKERLERFAKLEEGEWNEASRKEFASLLEELNLEAILGSISSGDAEDNPLIRAGIAKHVNTFGDGDDNVGLEGTGGVFLGDVVGAESTESVDYDDDIQAKLREDDSTRESLEAAGESLLVSRELYGVGEAPKQQMADPATKVDGSVSGDLNTIIITLKSIENKL